MKSLDPTKDLRVNDRFMLGGPLTLRGFNLKGVGPHSDGKTQQDGICTDSKLCSYA